MNGPTGVSFAADHFFADAAVAARMRVTHTRSKLTTRTTESFRADTPVRWPSSAAASTMLPAPGIHAFKRLNV